MGISSHCYFTYKSYGTFYLDNENITKETYKIGGVCNNHHTHCNNHHTQGNIRV